MFPHLQPTTTQIFPQNCAWSGSTVADHLTSQHPNSLQNLPKHRSMQACQNRAQPVEGLFCQNQYPTPQPSANTFFDEGPSVWLRLGLSCSMCSWNKTDRKGGIDRIMRVSSYQCNGGDLQGKLKNGLCEKMSVLRFFTGTGIHKRHFHLQSQSNNRGGFCLDVHIKRLPISMSLIEVLEVPIGDAKLIKTKNL